MGFDRINTAAMVDSYAEHLRRAYPQNAERFDRARMLDQEAAMAEAITFGLLESLALNPTVNESVKKGGPDFLCQGSFASPVLRRFAALPPDSSFYVEATSLFPDAVTKRSGIPKVNNPINASTPSDQVDGSGAFCVLGDALRLT